ncbi:unnamed protein product [Amoebophrya sp. A120]|nr:unnamed protein product [Amoebophrya sp. A120]|eukprot:GSA120T00012041001.1
MFLSLWVCSAQLLSLFSGAVARLTDPHRTGPGSSEGSKGHLDTVASGRTSGAVRSEDKEREKISSSARREDGANRHFIAPGEGEVDETDEEVGAQEEPDVGPQGGTFGEIIADVVGRGGAAPSASDQNLHDLDGMASSRPSSFAGSDSSAPRAVEVKPEGVAMPTPDSAPADDTNLVYSPVMSTFFEEEVRHQDEEVLAQKIPQQEDEPPIMHSAGKENDEDPLAMRRGSGTSSSTAGGPATGKSLASSSFVTSSAAESAAAAASPSWWQRLRRMFYDESTSGGSASADVPAAAASPSWRQRLGRMFYDRFGNFDITQPLLYLNGAEDNDVQVFLGTDDLLACQCVLLNITSTTTPEDHEDGSASPSARSTTIMPDPTASVVPTSPVLLAAPHEQDGEVGLNLTGGAASERSTTATTTRPGGATTHDGEQQLLPHNVKTVAEQQSERVSNDSALEKFFEFVAFRANRTRYSGERYYVPWTSMDWYRWRMKKNPEVQSFYMGRMLAVAKSRRTWWDRVRDWFNLPGYQNAFDRTLSDYEAMGFFSLNPMQFDTVHDDLTPLDAHQDLRDYDPFVRYKYSDDPDFSFVDPYLAPYTERVGLFEERDGKRVTDFDLSTNRRLVDVLVQLPRIKRDPRDVWRSEVEPSAPEDKWAYYTVPRFYSGLCQMSCEAQFLRNRARLITDSVLRDHLQLVAIEPREGAEMRMPFRNFKMLAASTLLIEATLVRYMQTGPHSVAKIDFRENVSV